MNVPLALPLAAPLAAPLPALPAPPLPAPPALPLPAAASPPRPLVLGDGTVVSPGTVARVISGAWRPPASGKGTVKGRRGGSGSAAAGSSSGMGAKR